MPTSKPKIVFFIFSVLVAGATSCHSLNVGDDIAEFTDLLASIISILIGVSLAISALLSPSRNGSASSSLSQRVASIAAADDADIYDGQLFVFYIYYATLILAVTVKYVSLNDPYFYMDVYGKILIVLFVFIATFSLLWSATLPKLLRAIAQSRL